MKDRSKKYLFDILSAIDEMKIVVEATPTLDDYMKNRTVQLAVERLLSIIGEATSRLEKSGSQVLFGHVRQIKGLRNKIIHDYDDLDENMIWETIQQDLPILRQEIYEILKDDPEFTG